ncbi:MAG TPA: ATP-binding protein [Bryobacteraceae bacterium]|nr:ATP-binding protein [Bryobacteraceae bacterium]
MTGKVEVEDLQAALRAEIQQRLDTEERLRRLQEEFDNFILTAAHDLREPLRSVTAYCELLARKTSATADPEADQFRRHIIEGASRIQALISGMVDCVTASSDSRYLLRIDMNDVFREAVQQAGTNIEITHDPLPMLHGDSEKLVKVFRHLLDNARKYCDRPDCKVRISATRDGAAWLFDVSDNGPGIETQYRQRVFEPFKRLHGRQYPGCGLGLAFCSKAIESHGGRMWVEAAPGGGASFRFTLPAEQ